jgi:hypothetical protein
LSEEAPLNTDYVTINPNQIKSIDNQGPTPYEGTFSTENNDIYYQENSNKPGLTEKKYRLSYNTELKLQEVENFNVYSYFKDIDYSVLSEKTSERFENYCNIAKKHRKSDKFGYPTQFYDDFTKLLYIKSNKRKNSCRYDVVDTKTGEIFKKGVLLLTQD